MREGGRGGSCSQVYVSLQLERGDSVPAVLEVDANFPDTSMNGVVSPSLFSPSLPSPSLPSPSLPSPSLPSPSLSSSSTNWDTCCPKYYTDQTQ